MGIKIKKMAVTSAETSSLLNKIVGMAYKKRKGLKAENKINQRIFKIPSTSEFLFCKIKSSQIKK